MKDLYKPNRPSSDQARQKTVKKSVLVGTHDYIDFLRHDLIRQKSDGVQVELSCYIAAEDALQTLRLHLR